ncbi:MAG: hypothetical protein ABH867_00925 [Patescibacteria group bacterium]
MASKAAEMVATADGYQFDWRLLPAIAGKESSFGKRIPWDKENGRSSHNAWGWGIYGDQVLSFSSWEEGIEKVGAGLRDSYLNKDLVTIEDIMRYYTPQSNGSWARDVKAFMEQIALEEKQMGGEKSDISTLRRIVTLSLCTNTAHLLLDKELEDK